MNSSKFHNLLAKLSLIIAVAAFPQMSSAALIYADVVLDYFDSGAGPIAGPYGGVFPLTGTEPVSLDVVLGPDGVNPDFLSLPTGSFVTVGFTDEVIIDGAGDDIFIQEVGTRNETADVFISSDGINFTFIGVADDAGITSFDLSTIGFTGHVTAVKLIGNDLGTSGSPGFDVANFQALNFEATVPIPPAIYLFGSGLLGLIGIARRKKA